MGVLKGARDFFKFWKIMIMFVKDGHGSFSLHPTQPDPNQLLTDPT